MSVIHACSVCSEPYSIVRCLDVDEKKRATTSYWLNGGFLCSVQGTLFPGKRGAPGVFTFVERGENFYRWEFDEAFKAVTFDLFGKSFPIEEAIEYAKRDRPIVFNARKAIFKTKKVLWGRKCS